jgi:diguanylate cyclase (GGDEF)-like protein/PAS domain S-box-containing protein
MGRENRPDHVEALLAAVSYAVKKFSVTPNWEEAARDVLEHLGRAADVSRAYIYKNFTDGAGRLCQDLAFEWNAPGIAPTIGLDWAHGWPYEEGYQHYRDVLESGGVMETRRSEVGEIERKDYEEAGVFSSLLVPVFAGGEWWGYMGYEDCVAERTWSRTETEVVRTAAETLTGELLWSGLEEQLAETEERWRLLVEHVPAVLYIDRPGDEMASDYVAPQIEAMLGISQEEWSSNGDAWESSLHPDDRDRVMSEWRAGMTRGGTFTQEYRVVRPDNGEIVWIRDDSTMLADEKGEVYLIQGVMFDVTTQKATEVQLQAARAQFETLVEEIPAVTYLDPVDENESSIYVSPQVESILGVTQDEWLTNPSIWRSMLHPDDAERVWDEYVDNRASGEPLRHEYRMVRSDGRVVWIREDAVVLKNEQGQPFLIQGLMYDITDRKEAEEQIAFLAYHDALTKLPNRAMFEEMLEPALARARRGNLSVAVLFMDLDGFKDVNDTLGHAAGDQLLKELAARLVEATRDTDLVARQGGDEFLVLLPDLDPGDDEDMGAGSDNAVVICEKLADRIHRAMRAPFVVADTEVHSSISVGISVFPNDALDARGLMKNADAAMYESKKSRAGGYAIHAGSASDPLTSLTFTRRLRRAVKSQSWVLQYQPVVDLGTDRVVSVEALVRWRRPTGDLMSPAEFLPLAEEMGLMEIIGEWVFEELCRQRGLWLREGIDIDVSFNLSPRQLGQRDLLERLMIGLRAAEIEPQRVIIEVSEATAMTDPARTQRILWGLHEQGLRIAVDDFGTGYSPPARIAQLPVDILKIDQPLVRDLPDDKDAASFVKAVVDFVRDLGTISQAEGIETEQQRQFLLDVGCQQGQGYLFSRPLPADSFTTLFKKGNGLLTPSPPPTEG